MAYTKYSLTPANNNATPPDGAPEGMLPSAVNDTLRDMMAQIRDCGDGIRGGTYTMTAPVITGGSITGATVSGGTFTSPVITGGSISGTTFSSAAATITGGSINGTPIGASTASTVAATTMTATTVIGTTFTNGNWTTVVESNVLKFKYSGVTKASLDSSGNLIVSGNVTAFGTP
jgi:hypothetical protein